MMVYPLKVVRRLRASIIRCYRADRLLDRDRNGSSWATIILRLAAMDHGEVASQKHFARRAN